MDSGRFDRFVRSFGFRLNRRQAMLAGVALVGASLSRVAAQEATPSPLAIGGESSSVEEFHEVREFLFVQTFESGTWSPHPDQEGLFLLTLLGGTAQTIYFSDRPDRITGSVPTQQFLDGLGFSPQNPPNAALVAPLSDGTQDVVVIELLNPEYDPGAADGPALTYEARVLEIYDGEGLAHLEAQQTDAMIPETMNQVSLFIDDCPSFDWCIDDGGGRVGEIPGGPFGQCWSWKTFSCQYCQGVPSRDELVARCNQAYAGCVPGSQVFGCNANCCSV